jgi:hypothetical protein
MAGVAASEAIVSLIVDGSVFAASLFRVIDRCHLAATMRRVRASLVKTTLAALAISALAALSASGPAAADSGLVPGCQGQTLERPFLRFLDPAGYVLAPDGGFEAGAAGWTLAGGARVADGNESYFLHASGDSRSLRLPSSSSASSPEMCVTLLHPTLRLLVRNSGSPLSTLKVDAVYRDGLGLLRAFPVALLVGTSSWQPTPTLPLLENLTALPLLTDGAFSVSLRFTAAGVAGNWSIDDVYVDPYQGR